MHRPSNSKTPKPIAKRPKPIAWVWRGLRAALRAPARTLASKIVTFVMATALVGSLAVTWVSARSIESFLREKIDQRFPLLLGNSAAQLDDWYAQRQLDVQTFAASSTIRTNVPQLGQGRRGERAKAEIEKYLRYVLDRFPQYRSLLVWDASGESILRVGDMLDLPRGFRDGIGQTADAQIGDAFRSGGDLYQAVSVPVFDEARRRIGSFHAVFDLKNPAGALVVDGLSEMGSLYVVSSTGEVVMQTHPNQPRRDYTRSLPVHGARPAVEVYELGEGDQVVGSAIRFERFDWTIAVEEPAVELFAPAVGIVRKILVVNVGIALVCCLIAFQVARTIVRPIHALSRAALRVAGGETDVTFPAKGFDEIGVLGRTFNQMLEHLHANRVELEKNRREIEDANTKLVAQNQELQRVSEVFQQLSITDDLTKLHNHRFFQDHLPREMKRSVRTGDPLALILIDIDNFKQLNDQYGHAVGDAVLKRVADVMNGVIRDMDLLARYGGEEFALLASQTDVGGAIALAEKLRVAVSQARFPVVTTEGASELSITISVGVAPFCGDEKALFNDADRALYRAKDDGKDCVVVAEPRSPIA